MKIGLALHYQDALSLKQSIYKNSVYDATATVLALQNVPSEIEIRGSFFADNKLYFDPLLPIDST